MRLLRWTSSKTQEKSKDRFDKHVTIRYFKFLVKVLIKGNKTPIGLGLENFQGPFYIWEVGRPLFLVRPSASHSHPLDPIIQRDRSRSISFASLLNWCLFSFANSRTVMFGICYCHLILRIFLRHLTWKVSILFSCLG